MIKIKIDENTVFYMHDDLLCSDRDYTVIQMKIFRICIKQCAYKASGKIECVINLKSISELLNESQFLIRNSVEKMRDLKIYPQDSKPIIPFSKILFDITKYELVVEFSDKMNKYIYSN